jgi:hypothetical protein
MNHQRALLTIRMVAQMLASTSESLGVAKMALIVHDVTSVHMRKEAPKGGRKSIHKTVHSLDTQRGKGQTK